MALHLFKRRLEQRLLVLFVKILAQRGMYHGQRGVYVLYDSNDVSAAWFFI
ncbi:hypothetical protein AGMMS50276_21240 [Synergistales bacterium]|nr:hypothetical protein AGMMS50276_21240 [Synergistales bacterium]